MEQMVANIHMILLRLRKLYELVPSLFDSAPPCSTHFEFDLSLVLCVRIRNYAQNTERSMDGIKYKVRGRVGSRR
jgi:hypothetical protein